MYTIASAPSDEPSPSPEAPDVVSSRERGHSYQEILRSSALIAGSSLVSLAFGIIRTKAMAVLLGPAGYGLMGAYLMISEFARTLAQVGVNASGVRQIAEAVGSGDLERTARTAKTLRYTALLSALIGALTLALVAPMVSEMTFGTRLHASDVALLSVAVFMSSIAGGQLALVQGMRRIGDLSRISILGSILGTASSVLLIYLFRERGIVPSLIAVAAFAVLTGWWYRRKIVLPEAPLTIAHAVSESSALLKLGLAFMASGLLMTGAAYVVRTMVLRHSGLEAAGLYQTAWTLGGLYVGFILQAMGADFYPRLVADIGDSDVANRLVNEQTKVSLLLAGPGVIATLTFAPLMVDLLYSSKFAGAIDSLRWICLGMALRVISWPMGYVIVAKNKKALFFLTELAWATVNVALTWYCLDMFGPTGAGIAFFGSYIFHCLMVYPIARRMTGLRWTPQNLRFGAAFVVAIGVTFTVLQLSPTPSAMAVGVAASLVATIVSASALIRLAAPERIPRPIVRILRLGGLFK